MILVLETWTKGRFRNRLVTDGRRIWLEYLARNGTITPEWVVDMAYPDYWLIDFNRNKSGKP